MHFKAADIQTICKFLGQFLDNISINANGKVAFKIFVLEKKLLQFNLDITK